MRVYLKLGDGAVRNLELEGEDTIAAVREKVAAVSGVHPEHQRIIYADPERGATELRDDAATVASFGIQMQADLRLGERPPPRVVEMNVGGTTHTTLLATLREVEGSRLDKMFDGVGASARDEDVPGGEMSTVFVPRDRNGAYVIDGYGKTFGYILDYLRDQRRARESGEGVGEIILPSAPEELQRLARDAAYCGLPDLVMACEPVVVAEPEPEPAPGVIYALGGYDGNALNSVERYDPGPHTWTTVSQMSTARSGHAAAVLGGHLYALGGNDGTNLNSVERYDAGPNTWIAVAPMSTVRRYHAAAVLGGHLYALGGYDGGTYLNTVERYDAGPNTWTAVSPMSTARSSHAAAVLGGHLYALGGYDGATVLNTVERYDPGLNTWTTLAPMSTARYLFAAAACP